MKPGHLALICVTGVISGSTFLFLKIAVADLPIFVVADVRIALGGGVLLLVFRYAYGHWPRLPARWQTVLLVAVLGAAFPVPLQAWGTSFVPSGAAALVFATMPLITAALVSVSHSDRRFNLRFLLPSLACGVAGVGVLVGPEALGANPDYLFGATVLLFAALGISASAVEVGRRLSEETPLALAAYQLAIGASLLAPAALVALATNPPNSGVGDLLGAVGAVCVLGLLNSGVGYFLYTHLVLRAGPTAATYLTFVTPPVAVFLGAVLLGEDLDWSIAISLGLIITCLGLTTRSYRRPVTDVLELERAV